MQRNACNVCTIFSSPMNSYLGQVYSLLPMKENHQRAYTKQILIGIQNYRTWWTSLFTLLPLSQCFCFCCLLEFRIKFDVIYWYEFFARDTIIRNSRKWNFINDGKNSTDWSTHFLWTLDTNLKTIWPGLIKIVTV